MTHLATGSLAAAHAASPCAAAHGDAARARRGCRSRSCGAIHRHRYRIAIGNARTAHEHATEGLRRRKRRDYVAVCIGRFNHAASRTARLHQSKPLRAAREALRQSVYPEHWEERTRDEVLVLIDDYIRWYNHERIKQSLGWMSPVQYRQSQGMAA